MTDNDYFFIVMGVLGFIGLVMMLHAAFTKEKKGGA